VETNDNRKKQCKEVVNNTTNEANNNELVHVQNANHNQIDDNNGDYEQNGLSTPEMNETEAPSNGTDDRNAAADDIDNSLNKNIENDDANS